MVGRNNRGEVEETVYMLLGCDLEIEVAKQIEEQVPKESNGQEKASVCKLDIIQFVACCTIVRSW